MQVVCFLWDSREIVSIWELFKRFKHRVFLREVPFTPLCGNCGSALLQTVDNVVVCRQCGASTR